MNMMKADSFTTHQRPVLEPPVAESRRRRKPRFLHDPVSTEVNFGIGPVLYMEGVSVAFDGFNAINDLDFSVDRNELRCVIGPNGAGKSTLMDIVTGKTKPDKGLVYFGESLDLLQCTESEIANAGIGRKFQKPTVFEALTCGQNLELAMAGDKRFFKNLFYQLTGDKKLKIESVVNTIGLEDQLFLPAGKLSHGQKQWLEIGMLLMQNPHIMLIDEPVAGMTHQEMHKTGELLEALAIDRTVVVVEHDMEFIRSIAKRVTVLHQGSVLAEGSMKDIQDNPKVRQVYLGE